jgi:hypothetical protein
MSTRTNATNIIRLTCGTYRALATHSSHPSTYRASTLLAHIYVKHTEPTCGTYRPLLLRFLVAALARALQLTPVRQCLLCLLLELLSPARVVQLFTRIQRKIIHCVHERVTQ